MSDSKLRFVISSKWDGKGTDAAQADLGKLTRTAQQATVGSDALGESYSQLALFTEKELAPALNQTQAETEKLANKAKAAKGDVDGLGQESRKTKKEVDGLGEGSRKTKEDVDGLGRKSEETSKKVGKLGEIARGTLVPALGAAVIAAGAAGAALIKMAVDASVQFESSFAGVVKTVDGLVDAQGRLNEEGEALRQQFRDMAQEIPVSVNALAGIGEMGGQLGVAKEDLLLFTETIAKVAVATNLTEEAAATSFAQIQNVMNGTQKDVERFASSVVALGNNSATTESQIVEFASRIAGAGSVAKLSMAELAGLGAAFSSIGVEAEAGGTAVQDALLKMNEAVATGNKDLAVFATTAGLSIEAFSRLWREDAAEAFTLFVEGLAAQGDNASVTLDKVGLAGARSTRAFLGLANAGPLLRDSLELANEAFAENNALNAEAEQRFKTRESQLQLLSNKFNDVAISAGDKLGPALDVSIERLNKLADATARFVQGEDFQNFVTAFTNGLAFVTGKMNQDTATIIAENLRLADSVTAVEAEFYKILSVGEEIGKIDPLNHFSSAITRETVKRLAEISTSYEDFEQSIRNMNEQAMSQGLVSEFNVYEVLGSEQEWAAYYDKIKADALAAANELQRLWVQSAGNNFQLSDREMMGADYATVAEESGRAIEDMIRAAEQEQARLDQLAENLKRYEASFRSALAQSATYTTELFAAQAALAEAQGEWVDTTVDNSGRIERINRQLASDLSEEQVKAYREILNTAVEGGAEWRAAWQALQGDLTTTQRNELVAQLGDLQSTHGQMATVYTGDAQAAEEAKERILAAQAAIRESYRQTAFEGLLAQASLDQLPAILEWAEQQGIIQEGEAAVRLQFAQTVAAIESRTEALANGEQVTEDYLESITLLTSGLFENEEQAALLAGVMSSEMVAAFMAAAANGGSLVDVLAAIGLEAGKIPTEVTVAFISDTSNWHPPTGGYTAPTGANSNPQEATAFASGGVVRGGIPGRDSVPALMMPGEYVLRTSVAQRIGYDTLDALNAGRTTMTSEGRVNNIGGDTYNITTTSNAQARLVATLADQKKKERLAKVLGY